MRQIFGRIEDKSKVLTNENKETPKLKDLNNSDSMLLHCEFDFNSLKDPFSYKPLPGNLSDFNFPDNLPNLPG